MEYKFEQTMIMERMMKQIFEALGSANDKEWNAVKDVIAEGCKDVAVASVEDYLDGAPWSIHDAVAHFKGEA